MNILLFCDRYLPAVGGVELFIQQLSKNLIKEGHNVIIFANRDEGLLQHELIDNIHVYRFNFALPSSIMTIPYAIRKLNQIINEHQINLINLHFVSSNGLFATLISKYTGIPLITSLHGNDVQQFPNNSIVQKRILISALKHSKIVTANSKALLEQAKEFYPDFNGTVIPSPMETEDYPPEPIKTDKRYVFSMGRFEHKKGFDILIKSFIFMDYDGVELWIAGRGSEFEKCQNLIISLNLTERVKLLGYQERSEIIKLYKECLFFVLPARRSPCDRVMLEAMAAGKALIACGVDGVPEMVTQDIGIVVPPENPKAMANAMITLLHDDKLRRRYEVNGRLRVQKMCNWGRITKMYEKIYQEVGDNKCIV